MSGEDSRRKACNLLARGDVEYVGRHADRKLCEFRGDGGERLFTDIGDGEVATACRQLECERATDATASAGQYGHLVAKIESAAFHGRVSLDLKQRRVFWRDQI